MLSRHLNTYGINLIVYISIKMLFKLQCGVTNTRLRVQLYELILLNLLIDTFFTINYTSLILTQYTYKTIIKLYRKCKTETTHIFI